MKKTFLSSTLLLLFLALLSPSRSIAQTTNYQDLIIRIPELFAQRNLVATKTELVNLGGIQYVNFCQSNKMLLLRIDRNIHLTDEPVMTVLKTRGLTYEIKQGATIAQVMSLCTDPSPTPAPTGDTDPGSH